MASSSGSDPATWVAQYGDYLFRYAMKRLRNEKVAEDIVQETFLAALQARERFEGQSAERTWLIGILKNKVIDYFRKAGREVSFEIDDRTGGSDDNYIQGGPESGNWDVTRRPKAWQVDTGDRAEQQEFWEYLNRCLDSLDHKFSLVFVLREIEEMATEDICNVLGVTPTNLRVILYRARKQLRACLETRWLEKGKHDR